MKSSKRKSLDRIFWLFLPSILLISCFTPDSNEKLLVSKNGAEGYSEFVYQGNKISKILDENGRVDASLSYGLDGKLISSKAKFQVSDEIHATFQYKDGRMVSVKNQGKVVYEFEYGEDDSVRATTLHTEDGETIYFAYTYDKNGNVSAYVSEQQGRRDSVKIIHDDKHNPFLNAFPQNPYGFGMVIENLWWGSLVNNPLKMYGKSEGADAYTLFSEWKYEYDSDGFPTQITQIMDMEEFGVDTFKMDLTYNR